MTEAEWLECVDADAIFAYMQDKTSDRKLRLYLCGGCREFLTMPPESEAAVEVAERFADGEATQEELQQAAQTAENPTLGFRPQSLSDHFMERLEVRAELARYCAAGSLKSTNDVLHYLSYRNEDWPEAWLSDCIFGNPFRTSTIDPAPWLSWNGGTVLRLAQKIYADRAFDLLPVLADALEEAGCVDENVLGHCRSTERHARGCWAIDLLLGKG